MNLTPLKLNDSARLEQARQERKTAAYHRQKAEECEQLATWLEAMANPEGTTADGNLPVEEDVAKLARKLAPVSAQEAA